MDDLSKRLGKIWAKYHTDPPEPQEVELFVNQSQILDYAEKTNLRTIIFDYHHFNIHHINKGTARYFGSTPNEILEGGPNYILSCIRSQQSEVFLKNSQFIHETLSAAGAENWKTYHACYVNCNITCHRGNQHRSLLHSFPVLFNETGMPVLGIFLIYDLEPFMASGTWWYRYKIGERVFIYHCENGQLEETDILSPRELEILILISEGLTSKDIAAKLFLSINTVDNHRRNMLRKTGATDTSALIYVCKLCQIF